MEREGEGKGEIDGKISVAVLNGLIKKDALRKIQ